MGVTKTTRQNELDRMRELLTGIVEAKVEMYARETTYIVLWFDQ